MKATLQMIADYDGQSKTYGVYLIADEKAVNDSGIEDGDEVEVRKVVTADQPRLGIEEGRTDERKWRKAGVSSADPYTGKG
jgi:hypothetical protein